MSSTLTVDVLARLKDEITGQIAGVKTSLNTLKTSTDDLAKSQGGVTKSGKEATTNITNVGSAAQTSGSKMKTLATNLPSIISGLTGIATSAVFLARNFRDLDDKQQGVNKATLQLSKAQEAEAKAQVKVNDLVAAGKKGTPEYEAALLNLQQAQDTTAIKTEAVSEAQEALNDVHQDFALSIVPGVIGVAGQLAALWVQNKVAAEGAAEAVTKVSTASKLLTALKIAGPIAAIAAGFLILRTNAFGARDGLEELGKKIGEAIPQLKPFLQWIHDLGEALGATGKALDMSKVLKLFVDGFNGAIESIKKIDWSAAISDIGTKIATGIKNWNWEDAWSAFHEAMGTTGEWINNAVTAIADAIKAEITIENATKWWAGFQEALAETKKWVADGIIAIGKAMVTEIKGKSVNDQWWKGMWDALKETGAWITTGIGLIGVAIAKEILKIAAGWWEGFRLGLAKDVAWVGTQMAKIGKAITDWFTQNATDIGTKIWNAIGGGITAAAGGLANLLPKIPGINAEKGGQGMISVEDYQKNKGALLGGGATTAAPAGGSAADVAAAQAAQKAWSAFSTSFATYKTSITANLTAMQTAFSGFSTSMSTYVTGIQTKWSAFSTSFATYKTSISASVVAIQTAFSTFSTSVSTYISSITVKLTALGTAFTALGSTITTAITAMNTSVGLFVTNLGTQFAGISAKITAAGTAFTTLGTTIKTAVTAMNTSVGLFVTNLGTQFTKAGATMKTLQSASSTLSTTISSHMKSMTSSVNSFASSFSSNMSKITSSMKTATSAAKSLASAINALKSKTITITTRYVTSGSPGGMHGAQWMSGFQHGGAFFHAQGGFSGMVNRPTTFKGGRMGEGFRPELVTVTPLTRGTGNHTGPTISSGHGSGGDQIINITVMLDGRVIQRFVEKTALAGIGVQI